MPKALGALPPQVSPPPPVGTDSVTVTPGARYAAMPFSRSGFLSGKGYRNLWTTPIRVPVFTGPIAADPALPPDLRLGERRRLRLAAGSGRWIEFWTIDHDAGDPDSLQTAALDFEQELITLYHPTAPMAAGLLYERASVRTIPGSIGVMADDPALGPAREPMAGQLVWRMEIPAAAAMGATELIDGPEFLLRWGGPGNRPDRVAAGMNVDAAALLRARLVDLVLGVQRHPADWWWARVDSAGASPPGGTWAPVAAHHVQAFANADGFFAFLTGMFGSSQQAYGPEIRSVQKLLLASWDFERPLLAALDRADWEAQVAAVQGALTDSVIAAAIDRLPPPHRAAGGAELAQALRRRRDALPEAMDDYFRTVMRDADVELSGAPEAVRVERRDDGGLAISARPAGSGVDSFRHTFRPGETNEVRLFAGDGDDRVTMTGGGPGRIALRLVGGGGLDSVFVDPDFNQHGVTLYDGAEDSIRAARHGWAFHERAEGRHRIDRPDGPPAGPDWGVRKSPVAYLDINGDLGLVLGGGMQWETRRFNELPYRDRFRLEARLSTRQDGIRIEPIYWRRNLVAGMTGFVKLRASGIDVVRFFGFGNEIPGDEARDYYNVSSFQWLLRPGLTKSFGADLEVDFGPVLNYVDTDTTGQETYVGQTRPYGSGSFGVGGVEVDVRLRPPKSALREALGLNLRGGGGWYPEMLAVDRGDFGQLWGELRGSYSPTLKDRIAFGYRVGLKRLYGDAIPFTYAAGVGGSNTIRGMRDNRYNGNRGSVYAGVELRSYLFTFGPVLFPLDVGAMLFTETGRVYQQGEESDTWHPAWGWGIWARPGWAQGMGLGELRGRLEIAYSEEGTFIYATAGTGFRF